MARRYVLNSFLCSTCVYFNNTPSFSHVFVS
jgi:hypothetical protein